MSSRIISRKEVKGFDVSRWDGLSGVTVTGSLVGFAGVREGGEEVGLLITCKNK